MWVRYTQAVSPRRTLGFCRIQWRGSMRRAYPRGCATGASLIGLLWCVGCNSPALEHVALRTTVPSDTEPRVAEPRVAASVAKSQPPSPRMGRSVNSGSAAHAGLSDTDINWEHNGVMRTLGGIGSSLQESEYTHDFQVDPKRGIYKFDCSGLVHYVLGQASPVASAAPGHGRRGRSLARDYYRVIAKSPRDAPRAGWRKVERVADIQPGDVIAWLKPSVLTKSRNTGHVAFAVLPPVAVPDTPGAFLVRIADASSLLHDADTRQGRDGFGMGTILLLSDGQGRPIEYGWQGFKWRTFETDIAIGRVD